MFYLNRVMSHLFVEPCAGEEGSSGFGSIGSRADFWRVRLSLRRSFLGERTREDAPGVNLEQYSRVVLLKAMCWVLCFQRKEADNFLKCIWRNPGCKQEC